jgi:hypothetical protein
VNIGNGQTDSSAKFAQYLAAARAGLLFKQAESHPPPLLQNELRGFPPQHTQTAAVSTNTAVPFLRQSADLTSAGILGHADAVALYETGYLGVVTLPPVSKDWTAGPNGPVTYLGNQALSLIQIGSADYGSAFAQVDYDREQRASLEANRALAVLPKEIGAKAQSRLLDLIAIAREEGLETAGPAPDSVRAAVNFLATMSASTSVRLPSITLDSNGYVISEWRSSNGGSAVFRFPSDGSIGCALTTPGSGGRSNTWFAIVTAENLRSSLLSNQAWRDLIR